MKVGDQLQQIIEDLSSLGVESSLMLGSILVLIVGLVSKKLSFIKGAFLLTLLVALLFIRESNETGLILSDSLEVAPISYSFVGLFLITLILVLVFPRKETYFGVLLLSFSDRGRRFLYDEGQ